MAIVNKRVRKCKMALNSNILNEKCRICLKEDTDALFVHDNFKLIENEKISLSEIILLCTSVQVTFDDQMPQYLCRDCAKAAKISYEFRLRCHKTDQLLRKQLLNEKLNDESNLEHEDQGDLQGDITTYSKSHASFDNPIQLNKHTHGNYECKHCKVKFFKNVNLKRHIDKHHTSKKTSVPVENRTCDQCNKIFQYRTSMLKHKRKHNLPPKSCSYCDLIPESPAQMARHMEKEHSDLKNVVCAECGKTFFKEANLRLHLILHSGVKRHVCEICGISFALAGNLVVHRRLHTGEKPYTCTHCGRGFTQQAALRSHEAGHSNKRDHVCPECGAAFSRAGALRNHRKRHLAIKPFACSMCDKAFTFSSERKRHMNIHTGAKNHICEVCGRRFNRKNNLKVHMRIHTGETPHVCKFCGKGFIQAHCMRTHMNTHRNLPSLA